jgi:hypothetical protein
VTVAGGRRLLRLKKHSAGPSNGQAKVEIKVNALKKLT